MEERREKERERGKKEGREGRKNKIERQMKRDGKAVCVYVKLIERRREK